MTSYSVAFNEDSKTATIISKGAAAPEGSRIVGEFEATATGPAPSDASIQHVHTMLYRAGVDNPASITVVQAPVEEGLAERGEVEQLAPVEEEGLADDVDETDQDGVDAHQGNQDTETEPVAEEAEAV